jgi:uncharacterized protein YdiU (UPF0061 family)
VSAALRGLADLPFDNTYARLHPALYQVVDPTPLPNPRLVAFNPDAAALIDLDPGVAASEDFLLAMSGAARVPGSEPLAMGYAGHQFGVWVPDLGDGRAILLGEVVNGRGERWELHLKGAGTTRYSRMGDGRSVLRSAIREYLAGEALHALGVPTTRALCVVGSDEVVYREEAETAATLLRLAPSHARFGTFEWLAAQGQVDRVRELADAVIGLHVPELSADPDRYAAWLGLVVARTARLVADWTAVGFAHGVLNTDNMSVLGLTLDFGPYGFLDRFDPGFVCNHSDEEGRYAFDRQPAIGLWNLARFAEALLSLVTVDQAHARLERYAGAFDDRYAERMGKKLGLATVAPDDPRLIADLLGVLAAGRADYTRFFRALAEVSSGDDRAPESLRRLVIDPGPLDAWVERYAARLRAEGSDDGARRTTMARVNPAFVLWNHLAQGAIDRASRGDFGEIERLRSALAAPFDERPELERYSAPAPAWARDLAVSCSS